MSDNKFDPRLPLPPVKGAEYYEDSQVYTSGSDEDNDLSEATSVDYDGQETFYEEFKLMPPTSVSVVSQTVRFAGDGTQYVDVVLEIEDVPGASEYESRMSGGSV